MPGLLGYWKNDLRRVIAEDGWTIPNSLGESLRPTWSIALGATSRSADRSLPKSLSDFKGDLVVRVRPVGMKWMIRFVGKKLAAAA
jgi:hypothetical protein